jgi:hypothetical protein
MAAVRTIQKNITRPTSVAIMLVLFQLFKLSFPNSMSNEWEDATYNAITIIGGTGLLEKLWANRKEIKEFFKQIFTKKERSVKNG